MHVICIASFLCFPFHLFKIKNEYSSLDQWAGNGFGHFLTKIWVAVFPWSITQEKNDCASKKTEKKPRIYNWNELVPLNWVDIILARMPRFEHSFKIKATVPTILRKLENFSDWISFAYDFSQWRLFEFVGIWAIPYRKRQSVVLRVARVWDKRKKKRNRWTVLQYDAKFRWATSIYKLITFDEQMEKGQ